MAKLIFERCILGLLASKTVIFVTNRLEFVHSCKRIMLMGNNSIKADGTYEELMENEPSFQELMAEQGPSEDQESEVDEDQSDIAIGGGSIQEGPADDFSLEQDDSKKEAAALIKAEKRERGSVGAAVIRAYVRAMGGWKFFFAVMALYVATEGSRLSASFWISIWSQHTESHKTSYWLAIYSTISVMQALLTLANLHLIAYLGIRAGRVLHEGMFSCLLKAPMSFFNATPLGRMFDRMICGPDTVN